MKQLFKFIFLLSGAVVFADAGAQDPTIQVLTQNNGTVGVGQTVYLQVTVGNALATAVPANKIRVSISAPASVALNSASTQLPAGFVICSNAGGTMIISNGTTAITQSSPQTILVAMVGTTVANTQTVSGSMLFAGGTAATRCNNGAPIPSNTTPNDNSTSTVTVTSVAPVTLTDFTAALLNCQAVLSWKTETEANSDRFEIEKNFDNANWVSIGTVIAKGNTTTRSNYKFIDTKANNLLEKIQYRLKMIDRNGSYKYSGTVQLTINCKTMQVSVYPNPVRDGKIHVTVAGAKGYTEATLMSAAGQTVIRRKIQNGSNHLTIGNMASGVYVLSIKDNDGEEEKIKIQIKN